MHDKITFFFFVAVGPGGSVSGYRKRDATRQSFSTVYERGFERREGFTEMLLVQTHALDGLLGAPHRPPRGTRGRISFPRLFAPHTPRQGEGKRG